MLTYLLRLGNWIDRAWMRSDLAYLNRQLRDCAERECRLLDAKAARVRAMREL
jgi:hypothetical protein